MSVVATTTFFHFSLPVDISSAFATPIFFLFDPTTVVGIVSSPVSAFLFSPLPIPFGSIYTSGAFCSVTFFFVGRPIKRLKFRVYIRNFHNRLSSPPSPLIGPVLAALPYVTPVNANSRGTFSRQMSVRAEPIRNQ